MPGWVKGRSNASRRAELKAGSRTPSGFHLWLLLWKAAKIRESRARRGVEALGLCLTDFAALEALIHKGPLPANRLRKEILISSGSVTAAVDRLERRGLVVRTSTAADRRLRSVQLTDKGSALIRKLLVEQARDMAQAFSCLEGQQKIALAGLLRKLGS